MSPEERQLLQGLFDRMRSNSSAPRDREAEQMISDAVRQQPYAPYLLAQTVIIQDQALQAANDRLQQLEQELQDHQQQGQPHSGGFLSGLFGGGARQEPQRPVWNQGGTSQGFVPPPQQGGPWGGAPQGGGWGGAPQQAPAGGGFLKGALGTAAGVAGGVLAADAISSLFRSGHAGGGLGIADGVPGMGGHSGETIVNNYYGDNAQGSGQGQDNVLDHKNDTNNSDQLTPADWNPDDDPSQDFDDYSNDV